MILLGVAAYFTAAYAVLTALAPARPVAVAPASGKAHTAAATVPMALARAEAAAADLVYRATAVAAGTQRPATAKAAMDRDLRTIHTAIRPAAGTAGGRAKASGSAPHRKTKKGKAKGRSPKPAGDTRAVAALRRFTTVGAKAAAELGHPNALRAMLPQLGRAAAGLGAAYGSTAKAG